MLEPASVALHAVRRLCLGEVQSVALLGLGTIGTIVAEWLHIFGVGRVYATGHSTEQGELMQRVACGEYEFLNTVACGGEGMEVALGGMEDSGYENMPEQDICTWIMERTNNQGVDAVIDCIGSSESLANSLNCVRAGGQVLIVGNPKGDIKLEKDTYWKILRRQILLTGTWNSSFTHEENDDWHMVLRTCADGKLNLRDLITHRLSLEKLGEGLRIMKDKTEFRNKVMIIN